MCRSGDSDDGERQDLGLYLTGLGSQYPPYLWGPEKLDDIASRFSNPRSLSIQKLLQVNRQTGIETRSAVSSFDEGLGTEGRPPTILDLDVFFRQEGVKLATQACEKALGEWAGSRKDITHTVAIICTNQGNPGYDLLVNRQLSLNPSVDRTLLHGVGCAGGLAIMRAAAQIALGATAQGKPARILAYACELCTPTVRRELSAVEETPLNEVGPAGALFSDGAAAFVLCNDLGSSDGANALFKLLTWGNMLLPDTVEEMSYTPAPQGFRTVLSRNIPEYAQSAVRPLHDQLCEDLPVKGYQSVPNVEYDWALHPGGKLVSDGVQKKMGLSDHQLRATMNIYKTRGNSSSPTVLIVLDRLRAMGPAAERVVACSFGPGLSIEIAVLRRCATSESTSAPKHAETDSASPQLLPI